MKRLITLAASAAAATALWGANDYTATLRLIVAHNPATLAARSLSAAERKENMTGLTLADPEVEFSYQWGNPAAVPDKKTLDVSQSFDFATLSGGKRRVAEARNEVSALTGDAAELAKSYEVDALMTRAVYLRKLQRWYDSALAHTAKVMEAAEKALAHGDMTVVDVNSIRIDRRNMEAEAELNALELASAMATLSSLGGGVRLDWDADGYLGYSLPADFDAWCATALPADPTVAAARAGVAVADREISLRRSEGLPSLSVGYTSEMVKDANYFGVSVGVTVPLWSNRGRVAASQAAKAAAAAALDDAMVTYTADLRLKYDRARALAGLAGDCRRLRDDCDISEGLKKQFDTGYIAVTDYLSQLMPLLELDRKVIEAEHDYQAALADFRGGRL